MIAASTPAVALAVKQATTTVPIVFLVNEDPVRLGLVASLARPGGNATGINIFASELTAKRLDLLRQLVPGAARVAVLVNPANATSTESTLRDVTAAARTAGLQINVLNASTSPEIEAAFASLIRERPQALFVGNDAYFYSPARPIDPPGDAPHDRRDLFTARICRSRWADELRNQHNVTPIVRSASMPVASSKARSLRICQSCSRASSNSSSTPRPPGCSASPCRRRYLPSTDEVIE